MDWVTPEYLQHLIGTYGYSAVAVIVCLESMGLPLPGETILILAAIYAGRHHDLSISGIILAAATGAIVGDNLGYWLGREFGYRLLLRFGRHVGLTDARIKLGQYLFRLHGGKVVFFGRFIAVLRALAAFLAGVNRMDWRRFLVANAAGGLLWAGLIGLAAYSFGRALLQLTQPFAYAALVIGAVVVVGAVLFLRSHESQLEAEAERALPGPLQPARRYRTVSKR